MNQPTECKYCGCEEIATTTDSEIVFRCWSSYLTADDYWTVSNNCGARCAVQLVIEILRGNSPESPDSSSVTADQLAVSDYYEAVRQQVPWMTSIEHIDGLIEGYRQCGLMVWQAAELIKLIFGGGNEQAE